MIRNRLFAFVVSCALSTVLHTSASADPRSIFSHWVSKDLSLATSDNLLLKAKLFAPKAGYFSGPRPVVIFTNSWTMDEGEYDTPAKTLAEKGYIVFSYATRGFRGSQGEVGIGGPREIDDVSTIIDWLLANTDADVNNIGLAGLSYGGGISLLASAQDSRIKTAISMSAWGDLEKALYGNTTVRSAWLTMLMTTGRLTGRIDKSVQTMITNMQNDENSEDLKAWAEARSPIHYIDRINARQVPIFVANSYQDELFPPLQMEEFYSKLTGPKYFLMDKGIHASSAVTGLNGLPNAIWNDVYAWLDHYLVDSSVKTSYGINFHSLLRDEIYPEFSSVKTQKLPMQPLNKVTTEELGKTVYIQGNLDSDATSGIPLVSGLGTVFLNNPPSIKMDKIDKKRAAIYSSGQVVRNISLRGSPSIQFTLGRHAGPVQVIAYLYDVDSSGKGSLMTYGVKTIRHATDAAEAHKLELGINDYDVPAGHTLSIVIDTKDPLYAAPEGGSYDLSILVEKTGLVLDLPYAD